MYSIAYVHSGGGRGLGPPNFVNAGQSPSKSICSKYSNITVTTPLIEQLIAHFLKQPPTSTASGTYVQMYILCSINCQSIHHNYSTMYIHIHTDQVTNIDPDDPLV